jgi:hypothetical protein
LDEILRTHAIDPEALRNDDFYTFFEQREAQLLDLIEKAMGKAVTREAISEWVPEEDYEGLLEAIPS